MRVSVVIFSVLLAQTSASFFSELTSSIYSVQSSVGTLISNTAGDLKDTFDCTVFAVRQVFTGDYTTLPGYQKCQSNQNITPLSPLTTIQIIITPLVTPTSKVVPSISQPEKKEEANLKPTPKSTDGNTKANDAFEKKQSNKSDLLSETLILVNISSKLERDIEDLSKHVNNDTTKTENETKELPIEKVMNEINGLLKEEMKYKYNTSEINEALGKIITNLRKDNNNTNMFDFKEEIKLALEKLEYNNNRTNLEQDFKVWKEEEMKCLNDIRNWLKKDKQNDTITPGETITKIINTTEAIEIVKTNESVKTARTAKMEKSVTSQGTVPSTTETVMSTTRTKKRKKPTKTSTIKPSHEYDYLVSNDKSTMDHVLNLVSKSKKTASIMAAIHKNRKYATIV